MPNYDYECTQCGHKEEILQKITAAPLTECPQCGKSTFKRKFGLGIGLQFQGSGFYATDYKSQISSEKPSSSPEKSSSSSEKTSSEKTSSEKSSSSQAPGCGCGKTSCSG